MTTYKTMTVSDLGDNATQEDLDLFCRACAERQRQTGESDEVVTEHCWCDGDWCLAIEEYA